MYFFPEHFQEITLQFPWLPDTLCFENHYWAFRNYWLPFQYFLVHDIFACANSETNSKLILHWEPWSIHRVSTSNLVFLFRNSSNHYSKYQFITRHTMLYTWVLSLNLELIQNNNLLSFIFFLFLIWIKYVPYSLQLQEKSHRFKIVWELYCSIASIFQSRNLFT